MATKTKIAAYLAPADHAALTGLAETTGQSLGDLIADMTTLTLLVRELTAKGESLQASAPNGEVTRLAVIGRAFTPESVGAQEAARVRALVNSPEGAAGWERLSAMPAAQIEELAAQFVPKDAG